MAFKREDTIDRSLVKDGCEVLITLTPIPPHPWLRDVLITKFKRECPIVTITLRDSAYDEDDKKTEKAVPIDSKLIARKTQEFDGLVDLYPKASGEYLTDMAELHVPGFQFNAPPSSNIGDILSIAEIPKDIQDAVMADLQKIWRGSLKRHDQKHR